MSSFHTDAHNNSNGRQHVASGNRDMNSVSDHGVQFNYHNSHTTVNMPDLRPLFPELTDFGANKEKKPHHVILGWLIQQSRQPSAVSRWHDLNILDRPTPRTGTWILSTKEFQRWKDVSSSNRFLFMLGTLGSGKSTLIYVIGDALEKEYHDRKDVICIYLLFHKGDAKASSAASIWENLLLQLLQNLGSRDIAEELRSEFNKYFGRSYNPRSSRYLDLFKEQAKAFTAVYLIIDGLDSCANSPDETTQQEVLNSIKELPGNVRTLVSSRTELGVRGLKTSQTLAITPREDDISAYVKARIENDESLLHVRAEGHMIDLVTRSVTSFTLKSGMFLLARLHLDTLSECGTLKSIEAALDKLPEDLDEAFEGAINQIKKRRGFKRVLANHVLTWIVHAKDDLTIKQIEDSFAFHESKGNSWQDSRPRKHSPVSVCAGLVVEDGDKGTLRLVHESVKHRLERGTIIYENADIEIAKACLSCLLAEDSDGSFDTPLLKYASNHWTSHYSDGQSIDLQMEIQIQKFFDSRSKLVRAFEVIPDVPSRKFDGMTGLHAAVYYNLKSRAKALIKLKVNVNAQCSDNQTALHWAATLGRRRLTEYLVRNGAKSDIPDATGDTPIHKCLSGPALSKLDIVKSLVHGGGDENLKLKGARGLTPLSTAIRYGPTSVAQVLIENQEDLNAEIIMPGWTSLRELLYHGHEMADEFRKSPKGARHSSAGGWRPLRRAIDDHVHHLMQFILDRGVNLNRPTSQNWLPLAYAVKTGDGKMVQRLLGRNPDPADVNLRDPESGMSPLCLALHYKKSHIARQLVKSGSDLNGKNDDGQTPLIQAVKSTDQDLVWLLLKKGAQPNTLDSEGKSALHYAIENGNKDIVWLLMSKGGDVEIQAEVVQSGLDLALEKSEFSIAWLLHEHGADIDATDNSGRTALHRACIRGSLSQIQFLLDMGANINFRDAKSSTPLHDSVVSEREEVVGLLASRAPRPKGLDEQDSKSNTALILATMKENLAMVNSLLHHGASCEVQDQEGLTAVHHAAYQGFNDGLRALVAKAENIDLANKRGYTALHLAVKSEKADAETVDILCIGKADLTILQEDGYSAREIARVLEKDSFARQLLAYERRVSAMHRAGNVGSRERKKAA